MPGYFTNMSAGGGLFDEGDVRIANCRTGMANYGGNQPPSPALICKFEGINGTEVPENQDEQFWSCGSAKDWQASPDGKKFVSPTNKSGIVITSNCGIFIKSLLDLGLDNLVAAMDEDASALNGTELHVKRIQLDRKMKNPKRDSDGKEIPQTTIVATEVLKGAKGGVAKAGNGAKGAAAASTDPAAAVAADAIMAFVGDNGQYTKGDAAKVFKLIQADPAAKAHAVNAFKLLSKDEFLSTLPEPLVYAGGVVTLG